MPSSQSVQLQIGQNSNNSVPHSQSAYEIGQSITHQQALHQQLQQRFANVNCNSGEILYFIQSFGNSFNFIYLLIGYGH